MSELDDVAARVNRISAQQTNHATVSLNQGPIMSDDQLIEHMISGLRAAEGADIGDAWISEFGGQLTIDGHFYRKDLVAWMRSLIAMGKEEAHG